MIITVDVWDTLLRRACHPDAVKDAVSRYLILRHKSRIRGEWIDVNKLTTLRLSCEAEIGAESSGSGLDDEYAIEHVYRRWLLKAGDFPDPLLQNVIAELLEMEVSHEINITYKDPGIEDVIRAHGVDTAIAVSDFYMPWSQLRSILGAHGMLELVPKGYVSCDVGFNKRSGRLFEAITEIKENRAQWIHIGDNKHSDVVMAGKAGAQALFYEPSEQHALRLDASSRFRDNGKMISQLELILCQIKAGQSEEMKRCGVDFVLPMAGFLTHIYEIAQLNNADRILFFTREGVFFKCAYDTLYKEVAGRRPETYLVEVSRIATFGASLRECSIKEMMRLWNQYSIQSLGTMFKSLNIAVDVRLKDLLRDHGLDLAEVIKYPWQDARVAALFVDDRFLALMNLHITLARDSLKAYFAGLGLANLSGPTVVVDIGWRGTIQDNLAYLFPDATLIGCYWGLNSYLNEQPANVKKYAYGPDLNQSPNSCELLNMVSPLEMLTNSATGSVVGYEYHQDRSLPRRQHDNNEDAVHEKYIILFQTSCIQGLLAIRQLFMASVLSSGDLRPKFYKWWHDIVSCPPPAICEAFLALSHNETFGAGTFVVKNKSISYLKSILFPIVPIWFREVNGMINAIGWTNGFLASETACPNLKRAVRINSMIRKINF